LTEWAARFRLKFIKAVEISAVLEMDSEGRATHINRSTRGEKHTPEGENGVEERRDGERDGENGTKEEEKERERKPKRRKKAGASR